VIDPGHPGQRRTKEFEKLIMNIGKTGTATWAERGVLSGSSEFRADITRTLDVVLLAIGLLMAHQYRFGDLVFTSVELVVSLVFVLFFNLSASAMGLYSSSQGRATHTTAALIGYAFVVSVSGLSVVMILVHTAENFSRLWFFLGSSIGVLLLVLSRVVVSQTIKRGWVRLPKKRVLIIGTGNLAQAVCDRLLQDPYRSNEIVGFISREKRDEPRVGKHPLLGSQHEVDSVLEEHRRSGKPIDRIFVALPASAIEAKLHLVNELVNTQYSVFVVPDYSLKMLTGSRSDNVAGLPVIDVSHTQLHGSHSSVKTIIDFVLAALAVIALSPVLLGVAAWIKSDSRGPVFFKQRRYGLGGKEFKVYKFRTMTVAEDGDKVVQATKDDARVTKVGKILRRTSIDELPQLFNVLNTTMSLVGPRPHAVAHNETYRKLIGGYMSRHAVKPGITGWAQVNGCRGETSTLEQMQRRVDYDREYLRKWSIGLDVYILFKTVVQVFSGEEAY